MIHEFELDTGCAENRFARVRVLTTLDGGDVRVFRQWMAARADQPLAVDSETNAENPRSPAHRLRMVQISDGLEVWLLPVELLGTEFIRQTVHDHPMWICHYVDADMSFIENAAPGSFRLADDEPHAVDTQVVLAYYDPRTVMPEDEKEGIDPRLAHRKGLKPTTTRELSPALEQTEDEMHRWFKEHAPVGQRVGQKAVKWGFANVPVTEDVYLRYSALDPLMTMRLWQKMVPVVQQRGQWDIVWSDLVWQWDLDRMVFRGMLVDAPYARWLDEKMRRQVDDNAAALERHGIAPSGNGPSVGEAFAALGVKPLKMTKGSATKPPAASWDKEVLKKLADGEGPAAELARLLIGSRQGTKFRATYVQTMIDALEFDGRVHWHHRADGTTTGRNSAYDPPLQQLPKKNTLVRAAYVAPPGWVLVGCDFSQGEPRTMAAMAQDANLRADILSGDLNGAMAATAFGELFNPAEGKLAGTASYLMRNSAKAGFLAKCYGGGGDRVSLTIGADATAAIRRWESRYAKLFAHGAELNRLPAVRLESGRICPLWDRYYVDPETDRAVLKSWPSRKGLNYKAQGTQRDLLLASWMRLRARGWAKFAFFFLHDEIILCVPEWMAEQARADLQDAMTFVWHGMEFEAEAEIIGRSWLPQTDFQRDLIDA
jgi:DNA polymerase-1